MQNSTLGIETIRRKDNPQRSGDRSEVSKEACGDGYLLAIRLFKVVGELSVGFPETLSYLNYYEGVSKRGHYLSFLQIINPVIRVIIPATVPPTACGFSEMYAKRSFHIFTPVSVKVGLDDKCCYS